MLKTWQKSRVQGALDFGFAPHWLKTGVKFLTQSRSVAIAIQIALLLSTVIRKKSENCSIINQEREYFMYIHTKSQVELSPFFPPGAFFRMGLEGSLKAEPVFRASIRPSNTPSWSSSAARDKNVNKSNVFLDERF